MEFLLGKKTLEQQSLIDAAEAAIRETGETIERLITCAGERDEFRATLAEHTVEEASARAASRQLAERIQRGLEEAAASVAAAVNQQNEQHGAVRCQLEGVRAAAGELGQQVEARLAPGATAAQAGAVETRAAMEGTVEDLGAQQAEAVAAAGGAMEGLTTAVTQRLHSLTSSVSAMVCRFSENNAFTVAKVADLKVLLSQGAADVAERASSVGTLLGSMESETLATLHRAQEVLSEQHRAVESLGGLVSSHGKHLEKHRASLEAATEEAQAGLQLQRTALETQATALAEARRAQQDGQRDPQLEAALQQVVVQIDGERADVTAQLSRLGSVLAATSDALTSGNACDAHTAGLEQCALFMQQQAAEVTAGLEALSRAVSTCRDQLEAGNVVDPHLTALEGLKAEIGERIEAQRGFLGSQLEELQALQDEIVRQREVEASGVIAKLEAQAAAAQAAHKAQLQTLTKENADLRAHNALLQDAVQKAKNGRVELEGRLRQDLQEKVVREIQESLAAKVQDAVAAVQGELAAQVETVQASFASDLEAHGGALEAGVAEATASIDALLVQNAALTRDSQVAHDAGAARHSDVAATVDAWKAASAASAGAVSTLQVANGVQAAAVVELAQNLTARHAALVTEARAWGGSDKQAAAELEDGVLPAVAGLHSHVIATTLPGHEARITELKGLTATWGASDATAVAALCVVQAEDLEQVAAARELGAAETVAGVARVRSMAAEWAQNDNQHSAALGNLGVVMATAKERVQEEAVRVQVADQALLDETRALQGAVAEGVTSGVGTVLVLGQDVESAVKGGCSQFASASKEIKVVVAEAGAANSASLEGVGTKVDELVGPRQALMEEIQAGEAAVCEQAQQATIRMTAGVKACVEELQAAQATLQAQGVAGVAEAARLLDNAVTAVKAAEKSGAQWLQTELAEVGRRMEGIAQEIEGHKQTAESSAVVHGENLQEVKRHVEALRGAARMDSELAPVPAVKMMLPKDIADHPALEALKNAGDTTKAADPACPMQGVQGETAKSGLAAEVGLSLPGGENSPKSTDNDSPSRKRKLEETVKTSGIPKTPGSCKRAGVPLQEKTNV
ncbi:hypothetical protein CYMTET_4393 [Cymbomonas tetramitiformis]|uniref:Uncharacterized protein n=1 Tax=Cymbomonas tetramitiformis TaxID=36881 RepID=A0AAE0H1M7_9CHLO|nr:hypothetical protein CYMTET_4393 [Cymbomonas tetramitiformis]